MMRTMVALLALVLLGACDKGLSGTDAANTGTAQPSAAANVAPAGQSWTDHVEKTADGGYRMGNPNAAVKLIEYGARTCPTCALFDQQGFDPLKTKYVTSGRVSYEFRDYAVHGPLDLAPIMIGQCVPAEAYFPLLDAMMKNQPTLLANEQQVVSAVGNRLETMKPAETATYFAEKLGYLDFAKQHGLPEARARACLTDQKRLDALVKAMDTATRQFNISGTPTFIVNGKVTDANSWATLEPALKTAGA